MKKDEPYAGSWREFRMEMFFHVLTIVSVGGIIGFFMLLGHWLGIW